MSMRSTGMDDDIAVIKGRKTWREKRAEASDRWVSAITPICRMARLLNLNIYAG